MDKELLVSNIIKYCTDRNEAVTVACQNSGAGKNLVTNIRNGASPSIDKVADLAAYLGCTISDLVGDNKTAETARSERKELMEKFLNMLDEKQIAQLEKVMEELKK